MHAGVASAPALPQLKLAARWAEWVAAERGRFALWLPVLMTAGVVYYFSLRTEPPWWAGPGALLLCVALGMAAGPTRWRVPCWIAGGLALGMASAQLATLRAPDVIEVPRRATIVTGVVSVAEALPRGQRITLDQPRLDGGQPLPRAVRIRLRAGDDVALAAGDRVRVRALLMQPAPPAYPGAWDLQRDSFYNGLGAYGFALARAEPVASLQPASGHWLATLRQTIAARITAVLPGPNGAIATTLLTGSAAVVPEADRAAFRDSGLAHLLAIAGLHIGIVMGLVFAATRLLLVLWERAALRWPTKRIAALTALAAGGAYLILTGAHVPIIRSFAMACLVTLGVMVGRRALSLRGLALAMAALILMAPNEVLGVRFQMSFSAVLALIAGYEALRPLLTRISGDRSWWRRLLAHVAALALTSALAGTFSAPFGAYHFGHVQLYFVFANMLAVPLTAFLVMPAGLIALALMPLHLEYLALVAMGWGADLILAVARFVAAWPQAVLAVPHLPEWGLCLISLGIAWLGLWRSRLRLAGGAAIAAGLLSPLIVHPPDLLVSSEARLVAMRTQAGVFEQAGSGAQRFTREAWLGMWAADKAVALPAAGPAADGAIFCAEDACILFARGQNAVLLRRGGARDACKAGVLVSAEPIGEECPGVPRIDRFSVWREGAHAVWLDRDGVRVVSDRATRGERPWVVKLPTRGRTQPGTTPALAEDLPPE